MEEVIDHARIMGITKKINSELEDLPLAAHSVVFANLSNMIQYRQLNAKAEQERKIAEQQEKANQMQMDAMRRRQEQEDLRRSGIVLAQ